jgi:hypothetical protein
MPMGGRLPSFCASSGDAPGMSVAVESGDFVLDPAG